MRSFRAERKLEAWLPQAKETLKASSLGVVSVAAPLYFAFGPDLWALGWKKGQSVIVFCVFIVVASAVYATALRRTSDVAAVTVTQERTQE